MTVARFESGDPVPGPLRDGFAGGAPASLAIWPDGSGLGDLNGGARGVLGSRVRTFEDKNGEAIQPYL